MKLRKALLALLIVLIIPAGLFGLLSSETGSRVLLQRAILYFPGAASVKSIQGRLIDHVVLSGIQYQSDTESITIDHLIFAWEAKKLFRGELSIIDVAAHGTRIHKIETQPKQESAPFELPTELVLPVEIVVQRLLLTDLEFHQGDQTYRLDKLQLSAHTEDELLQLNSLILDAKPLVATAYGQITLGHGFPLSLTVDWRHLQWPMTGSSPQFQSEQGSLELSGLLNDYRIAVSGDLIHSELPKAHLTLNGKGRQNALTLEELVLKSASGTFQLKGDVSWQNALSFDLTATGENFNPAIVLPELPGDLTFTLHLKGQGVGETLAINAKLEQLAGKLRGYAVEAKGELGLSGERLRIDKLHVASGTNLLSVDGKLESRQSDLKLSIDAPELDQLWPGLGGSLKGKGRVQGAWKNPEVTLQAKGNQLRFARHSVNRVQIDIDYHPEQKQVSQLSFAASTIKSGDLRITKLSVDGKGTQDQHSFKADIRSSYGDLLAALAGSLKNKSWQGRVSRLDFKSSDWGTWQLENYLNIGVHQKNSSFAVDVKEGCLLQQNASICARGNYRTDGDLDAKLKVTRFPIALAQRHLPDGMTIKGIVNGMVDAQRQKGALTGQYRIELPYGSSLHLQAGEVAKDITLGASSLSGTINNDRIAADLNLALSGQDFVRGQLQAHMNKTQTISGKLAASMVDFSWLIPFVPRLSAVEGDFKADLTFKGTIAKPEAHGLMRFRNGAVRVAGHSIDHIDIEALAGGKTDRIQITGSAKSGDGSFRGNGDVYYNGDYWLALNAPDFPLALLKPYLPEQLSIDGKVDIDAEIQQRKGLINGQYRLAMPAGTTIIIEDQKPATKVSLGASVLTGTIQGEMVSANLELELAGKDYIRGQLQMDTGDNQAINGRITASLVELAVFNPIVPQLSGIQGRLQADMTINGTLAKPLVQGAIDLTQASVGIADLGLRLHDINVRTYTSNDNGQRMLIQGSAKSGEGFANLDGFALLESPWPVELNLNGENFEAAKLPEAEIAISPALKLTIDRAQVNVTGRVKVAKARIELKELPENSINVSSDEIILGHEPIEESASLPLKINANIEAELGPDIQFSGLGLKTNLSGKIRINKTGEKMVLHGDVDMSKASYKRYGQDLTVRKGRFLFNGPADNPWLDVEAIRVSRDRKVTAILGVSGPAKTPKTHISAEPALPEGEALAYLITGRSLNQATQSEGSAIAAAALSYGAGQLSWIAAKLGVDEFDVQEGDTLQDTLVTVGRYLNPDFYVGTKMGLFNRQASLILKRKITDSVSVETQSGESHRLKLNYEFDTD